jgi:hypothetical protein
MHPSINRQLTNHPNTTPTTPQSQPRTPQLVDSYGEEARVVLLKCLVDFTGVLSPTPVPTAPEKQEQLALLAQLLLEASTRPNAVSLLCQALGVASASSSPKSVAGVDSQRPQEQQQQEQQRRQLLATLAKNLKLAPGQEAALAIGLAQSPEPGVAKAST